MDVGGSAHSIIPSLFLLFYLKPPFFFGQFWTLIIKLGVFAGTFKKHMHFCCSPVERNVAKHFLFHFALCSTFVKWLELETTPPSLMQQIPEHSPLLPSSSSSSPPSFPPHIASAISSSSSSNFNKLLTGFYAYSIASEVPFPTLHCRSNKR